MTDTGTDTESAAADMQAPPTEVVAERPLAPPCVYLVADHLDAVLAAGEDLTALLAKPQTGIERRRAWIERIRTFELVIVARTLQAADRAREMRAVDERFRPLADLFVSGTAVLRDRIADYGDATGVDFQTGDNGAAYLATCGFSDPGRAWVAKERREFLIAGLVALGPLLDMCASFLDALEVHYALYEEDEAPLEDGGPAAAKAA